MSHGTSPVPPTLEIENPRSQESGVKKNRSRHRRDFDASLAIITQRDIDYFLFLQNHYVASSPYLYEVVRDYGITYNMHRQRLRQLYDLGYLERPDTLNNPAAVSAHLVYALTNKGRHLIPDLHTLSQTPAGGYTHAYMTSVITANMQIWAYRAGVRYISQEEILRRAPDTTQKAKKPLAIPCSISYNFGGRVETSRIPCEPDQLFGLEYKDGVRFFAVEADRSTETLRPEHLEKKNGDPLNSILRKLLCYRDIQISKTYERHFGIKDMNLQPMFVTTNAARRDNFVNLAKELYPNGSHLMIFNFIDGFECYIKPPPLFPHLWGEWKRAGKPNDDIRKAP